MRSPSLCIAGCLGLSLMLGAGAADASVVEPNGLSVPQPAPVNETSLNVFFAQRGESIDWQADAHTTPNAFSPLCGFTATYVLNQAGSSFGLGWYNDTGTQPTASDIHILVPAGSPVGTQFTGTAIKSDPAYLGGVVGFALVGGETHYTNDAYDTLCSGCNPPGPWVTALMYASTLTPSAYYVCFEDGGTSANGWNNDGDFNDDVFFVTGITCEGGGQVCDTGKPGICAAGITQCSAATTTCQQLNQPAAVETCNGLDDDCNGVVDDGAMCPTGKVCEMGTCVVACTAVVACPGGKACSSGYCIDSQCVGVTCPSGQVCAAGTCKAPCDGVTCPTSQVCRDGACVDPCAGVTCDANDVCDQGVCVIGCACQPCATGTACDTTSNVCVDPTCVGVACGAGTTCAAGVCVDNCAGAVCPAGDTCSMGSCVAIPDAGVDASVKTPDAGADGGPLADAGSDATLDSGHEDAAHTKDAGHAKSEDAGRKDDAGQAKGHDAGGDATTGGEPAVTSSGCGCRAVGGGSNGAAAFWTLAGLGFVMLRKRARRQRH